MRPIYLLLLASIAMCGCGSDNKSAGKDSESFGQKVAEQTQNASSDAVETSKDLQAAAMLTPKIKLAISADKQLNDSKNLINVDSTEEKVTLEGHVTSIALKEIAGTIATKILKESEAKQSLDNKLEIKP